MGFTFLGSPRASWVALSSLGGGGGGGAGLGTGRDPPVRKHDVSCNQWVCFLRLLQPTLTSHFFLTAPLLASSCSFMSSSCRTVYTMSANLTGEYNRPHCAVLSSGMWQFWIPRQVFTLHSNATHALTYLAYYMCYTKLKRFKMVWEDLDCMLDYINSCYQNMSTLGNLPRDHFHQTTLRLDPHYNQEVYHRPWWPVLYWGFNYKLVDII